MIYLIKQEEFIMMIKNSRILESYKLMIFFWTLSFIVLKNILQVNKKNITKINNNRKKMKIIIEMILIKNFKFCLRKSKFLKFKS